MADPFYHFENKAEIDTLWSDVWMLLWLYPLSHSIFSSLAAHFQAPFWDHAFYVLFGLITFAWAISYARKLCLKNVHSIPNAIFFTAILATVASTHPYLSLRSPNSFWPILKWTTTEGTLFWWPPQSTYWLYGGNLLYSAAIAVSLVIAVIALISFAIYGIHSVITELRNRDADRSTRLEDSTSETSALRSQLAKLSAELTEFKNMRSQDKAQIEGLKNAQVIQGKAIKTVQRSLVPQENTNPNEREQIQPTEEPSKFEANNPLAAFKKL